MRQLDFSLFETLYGNVPFRVLSFHPTEPLAALQVFIDRHSEDTIDFGYSQSRIRCGIWNHQTYELVSAPEDGVALVWNSEGSEIGVVSEYFEEPDQNLDTMSRYRYTWERYSWPEGNLISSCGLTFCTILNWPEITVISPTGDLALVQWFEADKSGLEFIRLSKDGDSQLEDIDLPSIESESDEVEEAYEGHFFVDTNLTTLPVFSPDGRYIVFGWQRRQHWWTDVPDDVYVEGDLPVRAGECLVGYVQIIDRDAHATSLIAIFVDLSPDWQPSYEGDRSNELLPDPVFINQEHFQLELPTGETRVYSVRDVPNSAHSW